MPYLAYETPTLRGATAEMIAQADAIATEYAGQGYVITLRQLYYQFVARGLLANRQENYKRLGNAVKVGRYAGLIDWTHITDRTRNLARQSTWDTPEAIIQASASQFTRDWWPGQRHRPEVWVEKEALAGVVSPAAEAFQVPWLACKGYTSASEVWAAAQRFVRQRKHNLTPVVIHLGDHDPSGIDMSRDIRDRLAQFCLSHGQEPPEFVRVALNMPQIEEYRPPPNPAKTTDSRFEDYAGIYGDESWELDALPPDVLDTLIRDTIDGYITDRAAWGRWQEQQRRERDVLLAVADNWETVADEYGA
jgi:hypothetical protein